VLRGVGLVGYGLGLVGLAIDPALLCGWVVTCFVWLCMGGVGGGWCLDLLAWCWCYIYILE